MKYYQTISMAFKAIFANKMRSFLTMLGIIIGVSSVIMLVTLVNGYSKKQMEMWYTMGQNTISVSYNSWNTDLTDELYDFCTGLTDYIMGITPSATSWASSIKYKSKSISDTTIYFGNDQYAICSNYQLSMGRNIAYTDVKNRIPVAVIGERVRKDLFGLENPVGKKIRINGKTFTVVGAFEEKNGGAQYSADDMVLLPHSIMRTLTGSSRVDQYIVKARDAETTDKAVEEISAFLRPKFRQEWEYNVYSENQWKDMESESARIASMIVGGIAGISLLVGGIGIMNIMLVSVTERTREIGIRTAIGARRRDIVLQFLIEAGAISACGGLLGIAFGALGSALGGAWLLKMVVTPSPVIMLGAFLFSVFLGVFFGFYPANKASKLQPVEALRAQ